MAEIKISELSIGDWVMMGGKNFQISHLTLAGDVYGYRRTDNSYTGEEYYDGEIGDVHPIPLTPEILEKNGFDAPKAKVWNDSWYWSNRKDVALELRESFGLWYMEIVTKEQRSGLQSNRKLGIGFKYVHQLQHALRLAGVEKEIEV